MGTWSNKLLDTTALARPWVVGSSGIPERNVSKWFLNSRKSPEFSYLPIYPKSNLSSQIYHTNSSNPSLPNHTSETNYLKPNLQNQTFQTKPTKPNQNLQRNKSKAPKLNSWAKLANPNVNQSQTSLSLPWAWHSSAPACCQAQIQLQL